MLTAEQQAARQFRVTASFLPALMQGDEAAILREWMRLVGHPDYEPLDLSDQWPPCFGQYVEPFALDWHQRKTGHPITRRGETVVHPMLDYVSCTLDGWREADDCVIDAKCCGHWQALEAIESHYTPQIVAQVACTGAAKGALLVVHGGGEPQELPIYIDADYAATMWKRVEQFWKCVETLTPPVPIPVITPPERWRTVNLDNECDRRAHNWSQEIIENLLLWNVMEPHAKQFEGAKEKVKSLMPADVGLVTIAGIAVRRARNNAITIRHAKQQAA